MSEYRSPAVERRYMFIGPTLVELEFHVSVVDVR